MKRQPGTTQRKTGSGRSRTDSFFLSFFLLMDLFPLRWVAVVDTSSLQRSILFSILHQSHFFFDSFPLVDFHFICLFLANVFMVDRSVKRMNRDLVIKAFKRIGVTRLNEMLMKEYLSRFNRIFVLSQS